MGQPIRTTSTNSMKKKKRRRRKIIRLLFPISLVILVIVGIVLLASFIANKIQGGPASSDTSVAASSEPASTSSTASTTTTGSAQTTAPTSSATASVGGQPPLNTAFFNDTAFIGDSRTEGLMLYTGLDNATFYAHKGLNVSTYFTSKIIKSGNAKVTIPDALKAKQFKKVYIMLGINELGWAYDTVFIKQYGDLVDNVKSLQPGATVYVQSILPVTKAKSDSDKIYNNPKIDQYNALLAAMAQEKGVRYLKVGEAVGLDGGALPAEATADGVHLNKTYCYKWLDYLTSHSN